MGERASSGHRKAQRGLAGLILLTLWVGTACGPGDRSPEEEILASLDAIEAAAEAGDVGVIKDFVSESYRDARGNDRRALAAWLTLRIMEQRSRHVLKRVRSLEVDGDQARVGIVAGMAGSPVDGPEDFLAMRADVYAIDLVLTRESDEQWRVQDASWKKAQASDLL